MLTQLCTEKYFGFSFLWMFVLANVTLVQQWFRSTFDRSAAGQSWDGGETGGGWGVTAHEDGGFLGFTERLCMLQRVKLLSEGDMQTTGSEVIYIDLCSVCTHTTQLCMRDEDLHNMYTLRLRLQKKEGQCFSLFYDLCLAVFAWSHM